MGSSPTKSPTRFPTTFAPTEDPTVRPETPLPTISPTFSPTLEVPQFAAAGCLGKTEYAVFELPLVSADEQEIVCNSAGMSLPKIDSLEKFSFVRDLSTGLNIESFWVGISGLDTNEDPSRFSFLASDADQSFIQAKSQGELPWANNSLVDSDPEPNNAEGDENCVEYKIKSGQNLVQGFNDVRCEVRRSLLCEGKCSEESLLGNNSIVGVGAGLVAVFVLMIVVVGLLLHERAKKTAIEARFLETSIKRRQKQEDYERSNTPLDLSGGFNLSSRSMPLKISSKDV